MSARVDRAWAPGAEEALDAQGYAVIGPLLTPAECAELARGYDDDAQFRKTVVMDRHGFGRGEYRYFAEPLPALVAELRVDVYRRLAPVANRWSERLRDEARYPRELDDLLARCAATGQILPTPLLLRYAPGDFNCLHQDLYGDVVFPLQLAILLDEPGRDFSGGELVLVEQRPRMQSRPIVVPLRQGEAVVFACRDRPRPTPKGYRRSILRHGVSELRAGRRHVLGIIFHGARS